MAGRHTGTGRGAPRVAVLRVRLRYVGVPRSVIDSDVAEMRGWKELGQRMLTRVQAVCPVSDEADQEDYQGPHLRDTLEVRFISGSDPRILIGTSTKGNVLEYLTNGTSDHDIPLVNAKALRWTKGGTVFFSAGHQVKGITANPFVLNACREVAQEG